MLRPPVPALSHVIGGLSKSISGNYDMIQIPKRRNRYRKLFVRYNTWYKYCEDITDIEATFQRTQVKLMTFTQSMQFWHILTVFALFCVFIALSID